MAKIERQSKRKTLYWGHLWRSHALNLSKHRFLFFFLRPLSKAPIFGFLFQTPVPGICDLVIFLDKATGVVLEVGML
jgi:hypothetical protein